MIDNYVKISGEVTKIKDYDALLAMTVNDNTENITVITPKINISKGSKIEVIGKVTEYKGTLEVEATKIQNKVN